MNNRRRFSSSPLLMAEQPNPQSQQQDTLKPAPHFNPNRSRSKWSMMVHTMPEADLFAVDEQRSIKAYESLQQLAAVTSTEEDGLAALQHCRHSDYYRGLQERLDKNEKLVLSEYEYYALTTSNVNHLNIDLLQALTKRSVDHGFHSHIKILIAARKWQQEKDPYKKTELNEILRRALIHRGYYDEQGTKRCAHYLNLSGINLADANLHSASLDCTDLTDADLSHTDLSHIHIVCSCLNHANLANAFSHSPGKPNEASATRIESTIALNACFDGFNADNISFLDSDFTGSSFKKAHITLGFSFHLPAQVTFDFADFEDAVLKFMPLAGSAKNILYSMRFSNLIHAEILDADYDNIDTHGAGIFPYSALSEKEEFIKELDAVQHRLMEPILRKIYRTGQEEEKQKAIYGLQKMLTGLLIFQMDILKLNHREQAEFLNFAHTHTVFSKTPGGNNASQAGYYFKKMRARLFGSSKEDKDSAEAILDAALQKVSTPPGLGS